MRLLVVEDENLLAQQIKEQLQQQSFRTLQRRSHFLEQQAELQCLGPV